MSEQRRQFLLAMVAYVVHRDVAAADLCRNSDVSMEMLTNPKTGIVTPEQQNQLWRSASHLCGDPLFGLHFGESLQLAALGTVGEIIKSSDTVGKAIAVASTFTHVVTDLFSLDVKHSARQSSIVFTRTDAAGDDFISKQVLDFLIAFTIHELNGFVLQKIKPVAVWYPYPVADLKEYVRIFRCVPSIDSQSCEVALDPTLFEQPIIVANYGLQNLLLEKMKEAVQVPTPIKFQVRVIDYLMKNSYLGILSLEDVAGNFNMTPRSLQRRLQEESVTFQQLAESARKSLALYYMQSGKYQIKEISHILGYNELSAFSRAFKRWTGKTPIGYHD
jgi:AraC-like DNA-binding protein